LRNARRAGTEACPYEWLLENRIGIRSNRRTAAEPSPIAGGHGGPPLRGGFVNIGQFGQCPMAIQTSKTSIRFAVGKSVDMSRNSPPREGVAALPYTEVLGHAGAIMSNPSRFGRTRRSAPTQSSQSLSYLLHRYARRQYTHHNLRHVQSTRGHGLCAFENPTRKQPHE
jgi:hypothetical protein